MKVKKALKIFGWIVISLIVILGLFVGWFYNEYNFKNSVAHSDYVDNVGYIDVSKAKQVAESFALCEGGELVGYYHSAAPRIYRGNKHQFREFIISNFSNDDFTDTGMLNLRFHINCNGEVGNLEVNELTSDLERGSLSPGLVSQIIELVAKADNWDTYSGGDYNYYMYLNFKIVDGEIAEIIP